MGGASLVTREAKSAVVPSISIRFIEQSQGNGLCFLLD